jgi:hypothetical protein
VGISKRREFEWRVSIAFWTLLAAFVAGFVTQHQTIVTQPISCSDSGLLAFVAFLLGLGHSLWLWGLDRAYKIDKRQEEAFREAMRQDAEPNEILDRYFDSNHLQLVGKVRKSWWNFTAQFITTFALTLLAICVVLGF